MGGVSHLEFVQSLGPNRLVESPRFSLSQLNSLEPHHHNSPARPGRFRRRFARVRRAEPSCPEGRRRLQVRT